MKQMRDRRQLKELIRADMASVGRTMDDALFGLAPDYVPPIWEPQIYGVYVVAPSLVGPSKIGIAADVSRRVKELQTGNWHKLRPTFFSYFYPKRMESGDVYGQISQSAVKIEAAAHRYLKDRRLSGEWFNIDPTEAVDAIDTVIRGLQCLRIKRTQLLAAGEGAGIDALRKRFAHARDVVKSGLDDLDRLEETP